MTWIKICGTTDLEDAEMCVKAGADALGFIFADSPRRIEPHKAAEIANLLDSAVEKFGVYVGGFADEVVNLARRSAMTGIQYYGQGGEHCFESRSGDGPVGGLKVIAAFSMNDESSFDRAMAWNPLTVHGYLLDSGTAKVRGGTGKKFDWDQSRTSIDRFKRLGNVIVAGGLTPENVGEAIRTLGPWGVDVVTGVEREPGRKDPAKVKAFIEAVRRADRELAGS